MPGSIRAQEDNPDQVSRDDAEQDQVGELSIGRGRVLLITTQVEVIGGLRQPLEVAVVLAAVGLAEASRIGGGPLRRGARSSGAYRPEIERRGRCGGNVRRVSLRQIGLISGYGELLGRHARPAKSSRTFGQITGKTGGSLP